MYMGDKNGILFFSIIFQELTLLREFGFDNLPTELSHYEMIATSVSYVSFTQKYPNKVYCLLVSETKVAPELNKIVSEFYGAFFTCFVIQHL